jgi:hypothetical protein
MADETVNDDVKPDDENTQTTTDHASENSDKMIPFSRFQQINSQKREAIDALKSVADLMAQDVPEAYQSLVPELPPAKKIEWIRQAQKSGIFDLKLENGLDSQKPKGGKPPLDTSKMQPMEMMVHGYK